MVSVPAALLFNRFPCQCVSAWPVESSGWIHRLLAVLAPCLSLMKIPFGCPFRVIMVVLKVRSVDNSRDVFPCERHSSWCIVLILSVLNLGVAAFGYWTWLVSWFAGPCGFRFSSVVVRLVQFLWWISVCCSLCFIFLRS